MFAALRRGPAAVLTGPSTATLACRALRAPTTQYSGALRTPARQPARSSLAAFHSSSRWQQIATAETAAPEAEEPSPEAGPVTEFADLASRGLVHPNVVNTITKQMRLTSMTDVQTRTINEALSGVDVIAQAKTGTGKTLGFLIPVIQRIIAADPKLGEKVRGYKRARPDDIKAIIISPTRELAEQIAVEAQKVVSGTGIVVQTAVGGTQKNMMLRKTQREGCHLLIGTPGRIHDILSDDYSGIKAPKLAALVMDEADRLLDQGFTEEIEQIKSHLPDPEEVERQNLMFSATIPRDVIELVRRTLRPGFHFARCVDENAEPTHERVPQKFVNLAGFENIAPALYELVQTQHQKALAGEARPFKAIVYFNSTAEVSLASSAFYKHGGGFKRNSPLHGMLAYEIHAKLSQAQRTRAADDFRNAKSGLLFSSDVTARGMDFPNVTHVIQVGLPRDRESYIHRLGRTARAGKEGEGWLFLTPYEKQEAPRRLRALPLQDATNELECAGVDMTQAAEVPANVGKILADSVAAHQKVYPDKLDAAFKGLFGSFQWYGNKRELIEGANRLAEFGWGMNFPPPVPSSVMSGGRRGGPSRGGYGDRDRNRGGFGGGFGGDRRSKDAFDDRSGGASQFGGPRRGGDRGSFGGRDRGGYGNDRRSSGGSGGSGFGGQRREPRDREFTERY